MKRLRLNLEWNNLRNNLPSGIELAGEYNHAWGTEYNGSSIEIGKMVIDFT